MSKAKHAKYSASGSEQWMKCPGALSLISCYPQVERSSSEAARQGTAAHKLLEECLKDDIDAYERLDTMVVIKEGGEEFEFEVDDDMADAVQECINYVRVCLKSMPKAELRLEQRVDISDVTGEKDMFGTADIVIAEPFGRLMVIDYKHGQGVFVDVEDNSQLAYYALGVAHKDDYEYSTVELVVCQPRCQAEETTRSQTITIDELKAWRTQFIDAIKQNKKAEALIAKGGMTDKLEPFLNAGKWCKFCPAKPVCPAMFNKVKEDLQMAFDDLENPVIFVPQKAPNQLPLEQIKIVLNSGKMLEDYIKQVFIFAAKLAETGTEIENWKLVPRKSNPKFKDDEETVIYALTKLGFTRDEIVREKLQTLTVLRKLCGEDLINPMTYKPDNGSTLAPAKDKRAAVEPAASKTFDAL